MQDKDALFARCDEKNIRTLDYAGVQKLSVEIFKMFARFGQQQTGKFSHCRRNVVIRSNVSPFDCVDFTYSRVVLTLLVVL